MAHPPYDPYYLPHHHHNHQQPPADYYYQNPTTIAHSYLYNEPPISHTTRNTPPNHHNQINNTPIHIPREQRHINTIFVSGLPNDVIPREIHNLFRRRPGFDSCQLKFTGRGNQIVAFVTFFNHHSAVMAMQALDGVIFDPQGGSVLHIELARSNSRRKRKSGSKPYVVIDKRRKTADDAGETSSDDGDNDSDNPRNGDSDSANHDHSTGKSDEKKVNLNNPEAAANTGKSSNGDLQPCSTLFIANLGPDCSEEELRQVLSEYPGFNGLKLRARGGMPVAFADYEEVEQATNAMQALQDSTLPSSDRGGMLIDYARSKMRKP